MFSSILNRICRRKNPSVSARPCSWTPPRLEELESRLTPSANGLYPDQTPPYTTVTNASVQIIPNLSSLTLTEKVTATVSSAPLWTGYGWLAVPPGTPTPSGEVRINLNNQIQIVNLNSDGQTTATFTMPLFVFMTPQELTAQYLGGTESTSGVPLFYPSYFNSPLYKNFDNFLLPAELTFSPLSTQQMQNWSGQWPPYTSVNGEMDNFGLFSFQYVDPGFITSMELFGQQLPGIFAAALGAYDLGLMNNNGGG
jgi:hypothetical protein